MGGFELKLNTHLLNHLKGWHLNYLLFIRILLSGFLSIFEISDDYKVCLSGLLIFVLSSIKGIP